MSRKETEQRTITIPNYLGNSPDPLSTRDPPLSIEAIWHALECVSAEHGGEVSQQISDGEGNAISCVVGIRSREFPGGIGIEGYRDGLFSLVYDPSGPGSKLAFAMAQGIARHYSAFVARRNGADVSEAASPHAESAVPFN